MLCSLWATSSWRGWKMHFCEKTLGRHLWVATVKSNKRIKVLQWFGLEGAIKIIWSQPHTFHQIR